MRSSDSPHAVSPPARVAGITAAKGETAGTPAKPAPDALRMLVRELARQAAIEAWRAAEGAPSQADKDTCQ